MVTLELVLTRSFEVLDRVRAEKISSLQQTMYGKILCLDFSTAFLNVLTLKTKTINK